MSESHETPIHFRGVVLGTSGFAQHGREWLAALVRAGFEPSLQAARLGDHDEPLDAAEVELLCRCAARPRRAGGVVFHHMLVPHFSPDPSAEANILSTTFEGPLLPADWSRHASRATAVLVPTEWTMRTFAAAGVPAARLVAAPPPIDATVFDPHRFPPRYMSRHRNSVWLLHYADNHQRGFETAVQAIGTTLRGEHAELRILPDPGSTRPAHQIEQECLRSLARYQQGQTMRVRAYAPPQCVEEQVQRYAEADVFIQPCRGEGWDRALQEAMLMELPVITSPSSALGGVQLDESAGYPVISRLAQLESTVAEETRIVRGRYLYEPTYDSLCGRLRDVLKDPDTAATRGRTARALTMRASDPNQLATWLGEFVAASRSAG